MLINHNWPANALTFTFLLQNRNLTTSFSDISFTFGLLDIGNIVISIIAISTVILGIVIVISRIVMTRFHCIPKLYQPGSPGIEF